MKNKIIGSAMAVALIVASASSVMASTVTHTVYPGDTIWKISMVHNLKLDSVTSLNPQVKNPDLIYPGQDITLDLSKGRVVKSATLKAKLPPVTYDTSHITNLPVLQNPNAGVSVPERAINND